MPKTTEPKAKAMARFGTGEFDDIAASMECTPQMLLEALGYDKGNYYAWRNRNTMPHAVILAARLKLQLFRESEKSAGKTIVLTTKNKSQTMTIKTMAEAMGLTVQEL
jgi:hypothetical protein